MATPCYPRSVNVPRVLMLVLGLLQAAGIVDLVRRATCEEACKRDGCDDDCTPDHDAPRCPCHCPGGATAAPAAIEVAASAPSTPASVLAFVAADQVRPSPDPREILHVPRPRAV
jgi:hypothetical protein